MEPKPMGVPPSTDEEETPLAEMQLLVVEDETADALFALDAIETEGGDAEVEATPYGERALELIDDRSFDCVLLDYRLPRMDGTEFVRKLRARGEELPVVVLTGRGSAEIEAEMLDAGADAYLSKEHSDDAEVRRTVRRALRERST